MSFEKLKTILQVCDEIQDSHLTAEEKYDLIFSEQVSRQVFMLCREMGRPLDYYDPDTTYEEDIRAFVSALRGYILNGEQNNMSYITNLINQL